MTSLPSLQYNPEPLAVSIPASGLLELRPFQIVSLWEMIEFFAQGFYITTLRLKQYLHDLERERARRGESSKLSGTEAAHFTENLNRLDSICGRYSLTETYQHVAQLQRQAATTFSVAQAIWWMELIDSVLGRELNAHTFMYIPKDKASFLANCMNNPSSGTLFDDPAKNKISTQFPLANEEITMAGNCYGIEAYTACVFHLMRAVEIGARVMTAPLYLNAAPFLPRPLELCEWGQLKQALDDALDALRPGSRQDPVKKDKLEYYSHAVGVFGNFKDAWRNKVSHARHVYQPGETRDVLDNTRQFMQHLALRMKE